MFNGIRKIFAFVMSVIISVIPVTLPDVHSNVPKQDYSALAASEAEWLCTQQLENGAFATYYGGDGKVSVNPYFATGAAIALTAYDASITGKERIHRFIEWYFSNMNTAAEDPNGLAGTIFDRTYTISNGVISAEKVSEGYDSTDSYSALFLKLLYDYTERYNDISVIREHDRQIYQLADVLLAGIEKGFSYAKPDYKVMYLMDNSEVYLGLCSAAKLFEQLQDDVYVNRLKQAAETLQDSFLEIWFRVDHFRSAIKPALVGYTSIGVFSWYSFYPDAASQVYPIVYGLVDAESRVAQIVYASFCRHWNWQDLDYISKGADSFYWGMFARCAVAMGDKERFDCYLAQYTSAIENNRAYPLYCFDSAMVLLALVAAGNWE